MNTRGRPAEIHIELTDERREELRQVARHAVGRVSERAHFVLLSDQGKSVPEIASLMGYSAETVYTWLERYRQLGIKGLEDEARSGRPPKIPGLIGIVQAQVSQSPGCSGYVFSCWTVALLVTHLWQRFKVKATSSAVRRALPLAGFVWGRPKLVLPKRKDPQAEAKLARLNQVLAEPGVTIVAEDECEVHLLPTLRAMWHRRGQQPRIPTPGKNQRRPIFGGVNLRTGAWHYLTAQRKRGAEFITFLATLLVLYPVGPIHVLVDNVSIHTSKAVIAWLAENPRLELVYLPTYSGHELNPVEKVWWHLKGKIAANRCFKTLADLDQAITRHFTNITSDEIFSLINSAIVRQAQLPMAA
jgi:transposase